MNLLHTALAGLTALCLAASMPVAYADNQITPTPEASQSADAPAPLPEPEAAPTPDEQPHPEDAPSSSPSPDDPLGNQPADGASESRSRLVQDDTLEDAKGNRDANVEAQPATTLRTQKNVRHSYGKYSSVYDIYVGDVDLNRPIGVLFYFDADSYDPKNFRYFNEQFVERLQQSTGKRNMVLVIPHVPGGRGKENLYTWSDEAAKGEYARDLIQTVLQRSELSEQNVWLAGWSGGAEVIATYLMARQQTWLRGGGVILIGGGEAEKGVATPNNDVRRVPMRWYIGDQDGYGATWPPTWSATVAAKRGISSYRNAGFINTQLFVLKNQNHSYDVPSLIEREMNTNWNANGIPPSVYPVRGDLVSIDPKGVLWNYNGHVGPIGAQTQIGSGWSNFAYHEQTDWNNDGVVDIFGVTKQGQLLVYLGRAGGGYSRPFQVGHGFGNYRVFTAKTCPTCRPSVFGIHPGGAFYKWRNGHNGRISNRIQIGSGWHNIVQAVPVDWTGRGQVDIAATDRNGALWLYGMNQGKFRPGRSRIGTGWNFAALIPLQGFQGRNVLIAKTQHGSLLAYPYQQGAFQFAGRGQVGAGWQRQLVAGEYRPE